MMELVKVTSFPEDEDYYPCTIYTNGCDYYIVWEGYGYCAWKWDQCPTSHEQCYLPNGSQELGYTKTMEELLQHLDAVIVDKFTQPDLYSRLRQIAEEK